VNPKDSTSAWITGGRAAIRALRKLLGPSSYKAHAGSFSGGANAVYWLEVTGRRPGGLLIVSNITEGAKKKVAGTQATVEEALVFPLLRGRDVKRWHAAPSAHILMTQNTTTRRGIDVDTMEADFPRAHAYLSKFRSALMARAAYKRYFGEDDPWWSMFNVSAFTFSKWKVVWREQASTFTVAVVGPKSGKAVIPDHKLMMVEATSEKEAHYLCAVLNSLPVVFAVAAYAVQIQVDTHVLENIHVPRFIATNRTHIKLAELSAKAHALARKGSESERKKVEAEINVRAASLWNISKEELRELEGALAES